MDQTNWEVERRGDGALIVRVRSQKKHAGRPVPDAVFSFRVGDPQYDLWAARLREREQPAR
jgi:hypothetical protein